MGKWKTRHHLNPIEIVELLLTTVISISHIDRLYTMEKNYSVLIVISMMRSVTSTRPCEWISPGFIEIKHNNYIRQHSPQCDISAAENHFTVIQETGKHETAILLSLPCILVATK